jgi:Domain of unknown function (DUF1833)
VRSLTAATREAFYAAQTGEVFLFLLKLSHEDMVPMYFVNNTVDVVSNGETYMAFPFDVTPPDDREDTITRIQLVIDNVDRRIVTAVRSIDTPATFTLSIIRAAEPNVLIAGPFECKLRNVTYGALTVSGDLAPWENVMDEPFPQHAYTPATAPGLFG